ncbi:hypothetical protein AVEN_9919-1 [Araneus ventricosus]|uniref:Uncharacterized protein n=1 Tax=Araneus ventricosus TaxID=182803 RepID=A0A4Y2L4P1_ARAVE|nr:hypothetical protein AVEN_9919-1 [Araneus ventricosus]
MIIIPLVKGYGMTSVYAGSCSVYSGWALNQHYSKTGRPICALSANYSERTCWLLEIQHQAKHTCLPIVPECRPRKAAYPHILELKPDFYFMPCIDIQKSFCPTEVVSLPPFS